MDINFTITKKQERFIRASCDEVLYGGAAGGGKSFGQVADAFLKALEFPKIKQLILRSSFPELERSLIITALELIPKSLYKYNGSKHRMTFLNGSVIEFGYLASDADVTKYQSAEYDIIRFDELTHFSEYQYRYMQSRIRGVNDFPKQIKSSTNPGSRGHAWVKERFIDAAPPNTEFELGGRRLILIPARVQDNSFLMASDPGYAERLHALPDNEKKALLYGDWNIFEGQFFTEFDRATHICAPFAIPSSWKRFCGLDYGLDMTACLWLAVSPEGTVYVYREYHEKNKTLSEAAEVIVGLSQNERITYTAASPDLYNRRQDTGFSGIEIMAKSGLCSLTRADNRRIAGWRVVKEYLKSGKFMIFETCVNLIKGLTALCYDKNVPGDAADEPHELTHAPEALRYALMSRPCPAPVRKVRRGVFTKTELEDMKPERVQTVKRQ